MYNTSVHSTLGTNKNIPADPTTPPVMNRPLTRDRRLRLEPALVQDTDYMVDKTYQLAPYLDVFRAY